MGIKELINSIPVLSEILGDVPEELTKKMVVKSIPANTIFIRKDDEAKKVYILCKGKIGVINQFSSGGEFIFAEQVDVSFSGDIEMLSGKEFFACNNKTSTECVFIIMSKSTFMKIFDTNIQFAKFLATSLAGKIYPRSYTSGEKVIHSLKYNLILYLINYSEKFNIKSTYTIEETRQTIADRIGVNIRSINRRLRDLKESGLINTHRGKIVITNVQLMNLKKTLTEIE